MNITPDQRDTLERALDALYDVMLDEESAWADYQRAIALYVHAQAIVRDLPPGVRRVRSDLFGSHRRPASPQQELRLSESSA